mmetsp:Transcript_2007/g.5734  ORF Transcript_2007/g.5734 Transcript_2007/m.5734 type:complete len:272 (+) Transcript_2007:86-901(+)
MEAKSALKRTLYEEYTSMFDPMVKECYAPDVSFSDPMISISGVDAYKKNVDLLGSRNLLGKLLFKDAGIKLHSIEDDPEDPYALTTRWTLQLCMKALPWQPYARFSGVSRYRLNDRAQVLAQEDFWDSINLANGEYVGQSPVVGIADFCAQLTVGAGPSFLPYDLLRRAGQYEIRRYPEGALSTERCDAFEGALPVPPRTVAVLPVQPGLDGASASGAARSGRSALQRDGLRATPGHYVLRTTVMDDFVLIGLEDEGAHVWPLEGLTFDDA